MGEAHLLYYFWYKVRVLEYKVRVLKQIIRDGLRPSLIISAINILDETGEAHIFST